MKEKLRIIFSFGSWAKRYYQLHSGKCLSFPKRKCTKELLVMFGETHIFVRHSRWFCKKDKKPPALRRSCARTWRERKIMRNYIKRHLIRRFPGHNINRFGWQWKSEWKSKCILLCGSETLEKGFPPVLSLAGGRCDGADMENLK